MEKTRTILLLFLFINIGYSHRNLSENHKFLWKSVVPFYMQDLFEQIHDWNELEIRSALLEGVSCSCKDDTMSWISQLVKINNSFDEVEPWAVSLIDSWGKSTSGLIKAEWLVEALGNYGQCVDVVGVGNNTNWMGNYCLGVITNGNITKKSEYYAKVKYLLGSCMSSNCSSEDTTIFMNNVLKLLKLDIQFESMDCSLKNTKDIDSWGFLMIVIMCIFVFWSFATLLCNSKACGSRKTVTIRLMGLFSIHKNIKEWLKPEVDTQLNSINGILFLTVAWIILAHTWEMPFHSHYFPWKVVEDLGPQIDYKNWSELLIRNSFVATDTLLLLCGILVTFKLLNQLDSFGSRAIKRFYTYIVLQITPVYLLVIGIMATLFPLFATGPFSVFIQHTSQNCKSNGWTNILFINNWINPEIEKMCLPDSWFFAVEAQFVIFLPILVYILWKFEKTGFGILSILSVISIIIPMILTFDQKTLPTAISTRHYENFFSEFYIQPWNRASPFLIGIIGGYILYSTKKTFKISSLITIAGWLLSTAVALSIILGLFPYYDPGKRIPNIGSAIYGGFHRFAWGVAIYWIIFASSRGSGGWIGKILSWNLFAPLGKVSIIAFMIALPIQFLHHFRFQQTINPDVYTRVNFFLADLVITYLVATILYLFIAGPFLQIESEFKPEEEINTKDEIEMRPKPAERYGIFYDKDLSICMPQKKISRRRNKNKEENVQEYQYRERFGIFYDKQFSVAIPSKSL